VLECTPNIKTFLKQNTISSNNRIREIGKYSKVELQNTESLLPYLAHVRLVLTGCKNLMLSDTNLLEDIKYSKNFLNLRIFNYPEFMESQKNLNLKKSK
jgi:hypothetical protein